MALRDIAFLALFAFMLTNAVRCLHSGTMLWAWIALCAPQQYMFGIAGQLPLNKIAVVATFISMFVDQTKRKPYVDWHILLVGLFVLQGAISYSVGLSNTPRTYDLFEKMMKIYVLCCVMTMANRGRLQIHAMVIVICLGMGIHGVLEGFKYISSAGGHKVVAPSSIGDNNYLAMATIMVMPLLVYLFRYSESRLVRFSFMGTLLACFAGVIATSSRGGMVGLAVLGVFLFVHSRRKMLSLLTITALVVGLLALAPGEWMQRMDTIFTAQQDDSFLTRVSSWKLHVIMALDRPLVGGGYSALENWVIFDIYKHKLHTLDFIIVSPDNAVPFAAHSAYFETLGDLGFPGLFLFLAILFVGFRNVNRILRYTRSAESLIWAHDLAQMLRLSLIVFMVCGALLSVAYFEFLYIILTQVSVLRHYLEETVPVKKPWAADIYDAVPAVPVGVARAVPQPGRLGLY